jgi:hypothetical protein
VNRAEGIAERLLAVRRRVADAEARAGRAPGSVRLLAVSKTMPPEDVAAAAAAGQRDFGENYGQELRDKRLALRAIGGADPATRLRWHFIGPLQTNKVKYVAGQVALIHTIDGVGLLDELARRLAADRGLAPGFVQECLVQVNVGREPQKRGLAPEALGELLLAVGRFPGVRCVGLMAIPPVADDPEASRPHFAALRRLRDEHAACARPGVDLRELSMGMSHDLEVAVAEGATIVRVGTAIFGARA